MRGRGLAEPVHTSRPLVIGGAEIGHVQLSTRSSSSSSRHNFFHWRSDNGGFPNMQNCA